MTEKQIQEAAREAFREIEDVDFACDRKQLLVMQNFAFQAGANWSLENRWVKVKDSLPDDMSKKITYSEKTKRFKLAWYNQYHKCWLSNTNKVNNITHWCELPIPPKY